MQRPRIFLTAFANDAHSHASFVSALQQHSVEPNLPQDQFVRFSSEYLSYCYLYPDSLRAANESLFWFGQKLQGVLLLVDVDEGLTAALRDSVKLSVLLHIPIVAVVLLHRAETQEDWSAWVESELRRELSVESIRSDSIPFVRWDLHAPERVGHIIEALDAAFSTAPRLESKPLQIEFASDCAFFDSFVGIYWQGTIEPGKKYLLVGNNSHREVTLRSASEPNPMPGNRVICKLEGATRDDFKTPRLLYQASGKSQMKRYDVLFTRSTLPTWMEGSLLLRAVSSWSWLEYRYPYAPKEISVKCGPVKLSYPREIQLCLPSVWRFQIKALQNNLPEETRGFFFLREGEFTEGGTTSCGVGVFV
jgi:hypothetical protein